MRPRWGPRGLDWQLRSSRWRRASRRPGAQQGSVRAEGRRHLQGRLRVVVRLHGRLRPDRRVLHLLLGDRVEPDDQDARGLQPRRRAGRERARAGHRDVGAEADGRRHDLHLPPQAGREVRPPCQPRRSPRRTSSTRSSGSPARRTARSTRSTTRAIKGFDAYGAGKAKTISGITTPNTSTIVFHLTQPTGDFLYRLAMPATGPIPVEVAKCFEGQAGQVRERCRLDRPVHDRGRRQGRRLLVREAEADERLRRPDHHDARPQPRLRPEDRLTRRAPELPRPVPVHDRPERDGHRRQGRAPATSRTRTRRAFRRSRSSIRHGLVEEAVPHLNPADLVEYITMNLTQPPFDDIHVRGR